MEDNKKRRNRIIRLIIIIIIILLLLKACGVYQKKKGSQPVVSPQGTEQVNTSSGEQEDNQTVIENPSQTITERPYYFEGDGIHAVVTKDTYFYRDKEKTEVIAILKRGTHITIPTENLQLRNDGSVILEEGFPYYFALWEGQQGYLASEDASYFVFDQTANYSLTSDVSSFNYPTDFKTSEDYELYLLENHFNYAILRIGGRGYGAEGNIYPDNHVGIFADACEYLGVPYGYYFVDEAITEQEIIEEAEFIKNYYQKNPSTFAVLPMTIDMEYQHGEGRSDNLWEARVPLVNQLIDLLKQEGIESMVYANGARIETYLKDLNTVYWTAMYPEDGQIPDAFYPEYIEEEEQKNRENPDNIENSVLNTKINRGGTDTVEYSKEYFQKVVGWQFTENAAESAGIHGKLDLSLLNNDFFKDYYLTVLNHNKQNENLPTGQTGVNDNNDGQTENIEDGSDGQSGNPNGNANLSGTANGNGNQSGNTSGSGNQSETTNNHEGQSENQNNQSSGEAEAIGETQSGEQSSEDTRPPFVIDRTGFPIDDNPGEDENEYGKVIVYDKNGEFNYQEQLDIFKNSRVQGNTKIAPGSSGEYTFYVKNNSNRKANYYIQMQDKSQYPINMKYRLKCNGSFVVGNQNTWVTASQLKTSYKDIRTNKQDMYTLEWQWFHNDTNDTIAGAKMTSSYELTIDVLFNTGE